MLVLALAKPQRVIRSEVYSKFKYYSNLSDDVEAMNAYSVTEASMPMQGQCHSSGLSASRNQSDNLRGFRKKMAYRLANTYHGIDGHLI